MRSLNILFSSMILLGQTHISPKDNTASYSIEVPSSVVKLVKDKYPSLSDLRFSILEQGKVYKADFEVAGKSVAVVANKTQILNLFEESGSARVSAVSTELSRLDIGHGDLLNLKTLTTPGLADRQVADYFVGGAHYNLSVDGSGDVEVSARQIAYLTNSLEDLPDKIQTYIAQRNKPNADYVSKLPLLEKHLKDLLSEQNELVFSSCITYMLPDKSKQYEVLVNFYGISDLPLVFDDRGNLLWVGSFNRLESLANFDDMSGGTSNVSEEDLQYFGNQFKSINQFKGYNLEGPISRSKAELNAYENEKGYQFRISKPLDSSDESWVLRYDKNKKLIDSYYSGRRK
jgi:hypothetical protein